MNKIEDKNSNKNIIPKDGEIDIVYIWCDSEKKDFIESRAYYSKKYNLNNYWSETRNHDEIIHSIRSVRRNMKWVRNIFICTPKGHKVKNLDEKEYKVYYVSNEEILGKENCPNFNSHSLELFTYKIKGLSDYFIQFNDDFFVNNKIELRDFYNFNENKIKYYYENFLYLGKPLSYTTKNIIKNLTGDKYYFWPTHSPRMFYKNDIKYIVKNYKEEILKTKKSRFRSSFDFQIVHFYGYYLLSKNKGDFIFLNNVINYSNLILSIKILLNKFLSENIFNVFFQIYLQIFYKKKLYNKKKFSNKTIYALVNIGNNYKKNKKNIDLALEKKAKFICLNDTYNVKDKSKINKILKENYKYFYNKII